MRLFLVSARGDTRRDSTGLAVNVFDNRLARALRTSIRSRQGRVPAQIDLRFFDPDQGVVAWNAREFHALDQLSAGDYESVVLALFEDDLSALEQVWTDANAVNVHTLRGTVTNKIAQARRLMWQDVSS